MRYFFLHKSQLTGSTAVIQGTDASHIKNVLRLVSGDIIGIFDGAGFEYRARIQKILPGNIEISIIGKSRSLTESPVRLTVAQAMLKNKKMDFLIRHLTQLGIIRWIPFRAERSVPRPGTKRVIERTQRWEKIAQESLKQCKRAFVPEIIAPVTYEEALKIGQQNDLKIIFWEEEDFFNQDLMPVNSGDIFIMIGPEGGFTKNEVDAAVESGFISAGLGPRILMAETAAITAAVLIQYIYGDINQKNLDKGSGFY